MFTVLVLSHLVYAFAVWLDRPDEAPAPLRAIRRSRGLVGAVGLGVVLQVAVVAFPPAHAVFDLVSLDAVGWLVSAVAAGLSFLAIRLSGTRR
jgi:hypothetical protein